MKKYIDAVIAAERISAAFGIPLADLVDVFALIPSVQERYKECLRSDRQDGQDGGI